MHPPVEARNRSKENSLELFLRIPARRSSLLQIAPMPTSSTSTAVDEPCSGCRNESARSLAKTVFRLIQKARRLFELALLCPSIAILRVRASQLSVVAAARAAMRRLPKLALGRLSVSLRILNVMLPSNGERVWSSGQVTQSSRARWNTGGRE